MMWTYRQPPADLRGNLAEASGCSAAAGRRCRAVRLAGHMLETGGMRRLHVRGQKNIRKRMLVPWRLWSRASSSRSGRASAADPAASGRAAMDQAASRQLRLQTRVLRFPPYPAHFRPSLRRICSFSSTPEDPLLAQLDTARRSVRFLSQPSSAGAPHLLPRSC